MTASSFLTADVLIAYSAYFVGTASPGPSNL
ncbi:MAG: LysE family translocator, partial [Paraburkholderia nemoris]